VSLNDKSADPGCNFSGVLKRMRLATLFELFFSGDDPVPVTITGNAESMVPSILPGEVIRILPVDDPRRLRVGDVVVFRCDDIFVAHRLVWKWGDRALTKGDNNPLCDPALPLSDIVGVVEGKSSRGRLLLYLIMRKRLPSCLWMLAKERWSNAMDRRRREGSPSTVKRASYKGGA